jgi:hypothetical protein
LMVYGLGLGIGIHLANKDARPKPCNPSKLYVSVFMTLSTKVRHGRNCIGKYSKAISPDRIWAKHQDTSGPIGADTMGGLS